MYPALVQAGPDNIGYTPHEDMMPTGYQGITSFDAASPEASMMDTTVPGQPGYTNSTWEMPMPASPFAAPLEPMQHSITVETYNQDGELSADITVNSNLGGPISGTGDARFSPSLDTHNMHTSFKGHSNVNPTVKEYDFDKMNNDDAEKESNQAMPRNVEDLKNFQLPAQATKEESIYSHSVYTDTSTEPGVYDSDTQAQIGLPKRKGKVHDYNTTESPNDWPKQEDLPVLKEDPY